MKIFLFGLLLVAEAFGHCEESWEFSASLNFCYKVHRDVFDYEKGKKLCEDEGAALVSIHSDEENEFVSALTKQNDEDYHYYDNTFIGVKRNADGQFYNVDGTEMNYANWKSGEPNNFGGSENCVALLTKSPDQEIKRDIGKWNDVPCDVKMKFAVCKREHRD